MRETQGIIERAIRINAELSRLEVAVDFASGSIRPGQYFLARPRPTWEPYLRERWEPVSLEAGRLSVDRRPEDVLTPGMAVDLLGPCGKPVPLRDGAERLLCIADDAAPSPLVALICACIEAGKAVTVVLGGEAQRYPLGELPPQVEVLHKSEAWAWTEQVDTLQWADQVIALAPPHLALERYAELWQTVNQLRAPLPQGFALGFFTGPMPCGTGACGACLVRGRRGDIYACTEGPAIDLSRVDF
jgi:dihydroorotate dehydrogenase electron transfer subunit